MVKNFLLGIVFSTFFFGASAMNSMLSLDDVERGQEMIELKKSHTAYCKAKLALPIICSAKLIIDLYQGVLEKLEEEKSDFVVIGKSVCLRNRKITCYKARIEGYREKMGTLLNHMKAQKENVRFGMLVELAQGICWKMWEAKHDQTTNFKSWYPFLNDNIEWVLLRAFDKYRSWMFPKISKRYDITYEDGVVSIVNKRLQKVTRKVRPAFSK